VGDREFESNGMESMERRRLGEEEAKRERESQPKLRLAMEGQRRRCAQRSAARKQPALANLLRFGIPSSLAMGWTEYRWSRVRLGPHEFGPTKNTN